MNIPWSLRFSVSPVVWTWSSHCRRFSPTPSSWTKIPHAAWGGGSLGGSSPLLECQGLPPVAGRRHSCGEMLTRHLPTLPSWLCPLFFIFNSTPHFPHPTQQQVVFFFLTSLLEYNCFQCFVSFCFITKWISYTYTYIPISPPSCISLPPYLIPHLYMVTKHRADLPVLCSCFPLAIYFTFSSLYKSMPLSHFVPAYPSPSLCPQVHSLPLHL